MNTKVTLLLSLLVLVPVAAGGDTTNFAVNSQAWMEVEKPRIEWERHECAICAKTIWENVKFTDRVDWGIKAIDGTSFLYIGEAEPTRTPAEKLTATVEYRVCPRCLTKYSGASFGFHFAIQKAAETFIVGARAMESKRRTEVAQQNTQEELRRVEAELRRYTEQVKKLTEKLEELKAQVGEKE